MAEKAFKVVVTDYEYETLEPEMQALSGLDVEFRAAQCRTEEEVIEAVRDADGIINQYAPITRKVIASLRNCKVISRYGIGVDTIDIKAATEKGIVVANVADYCLDEVADHALALLLSEARRVALLNRTIKDGVWDYKRGVPIGQLRGRVLGIVGLGRIGRNLAAKAAAFGFRLIAHDPYIPAEAARELGVALTGLDELCRQSDYITLHVPLTEQTRHMLSAEQFRLMKPHCVIVNTARGPVIDEAALIAALREGQIAGAALDVLEREPMPADHPFRVMEQVILTPHIAWYSEESQAELKTKTARNVADVLSGRFPRYLVNEAVRSKVELKDN